MILIDTSAWVEFLRDTESATCHRVEAVLEREIAICDPIRMEVRDGAPDGRHRHNLRRLPARTTVFPTGPMYYAATGALYRLCRREGEPVRKVIDCLIGAVAIRTETPVLHNDADFDVLARHTDLRIAT